MSQCPSEFFIFLEFILHDLIITDGPRLMRATTTTPPPPHHHTTTPPHHHTTTPHHTTPHHTTPHHTTPHHTTPHHTTPHHTTPHHTTPHHTTPHHTTPHHTTPHHTTPHHTTPPPHHTRPTHNQHTTTTSRFPREYPVCVCAFHENSGGRCKLNAMAPQLRGGGGSDGCEVPGGTSSSASPWLWHLQHTTERRRTPPFGDRTPAPEPGRRW